MTMPIPEAQLETWSHQGASGISSLTYQSVRAALAATGSSIAHFDYEVYLQGSYKNDTNIRGDSDVDVVVQLNSTWYRDISALGQDQERAYKAAYSTSTYTWNEFRRGILEALREYFGADSIREGPKSLKLSGDRNRLAADIVPAFLYRKYGFFYSIGSQGFVPGIKFFANAGTREIINYPKPHYDNGVAKNIAARTMGWFKPVVRMFKNARTCLVDRGTIPKDLAPSYFLECMIYNAPDSAFGDSFQDSFINIFNWLVMCEKKNCMCQNGQTRLFGNLSEQWEEGKANQLLSALKELWENW